jgi:thioesterase DpgC
VGFSDEDVRGFLEARPSFPSREGGSEGSLDADALASTLFYRRGGGLLGRLPAKPGRSEREREAACRIHAELRGVRASFLRAHEGAVYGALTRGLRDFVRAEELVYAAADRFPGLTPTRAKVEAERALLQKDKEGAEIDQGIFFSHVLASPRSGAHLCRAMLRPKEESRARLAELRAKGSVDLGAAIVERRGKMGCLTLRNRRYLNAEDDSTTGALEMGVDLILLDPDIEVGVLRGAVVDHPRYAGRRVFNAGINLTHLYHGKISFLFYITRDLGYVNKIYRGLAEGDLHPGEPEDTLEKPWIAAVETFAIGGGCQLLLVMDRVLAEEGSYFNLPARKEGIIPGAANLRLTRFVGGRIARQAILFGRELPAASPEGALLCDEIVPAGGMDAAIEQSVETLTGSGLVSAAGNRKAMRVGEEPMEAFQAYMAMYAREQAACHFSPALITNLERNWDAKRRSL